MNRTMTAIRWALTPQPRPAVTHTLTGDRLDPTPVRLPR